MIEAVFRIYGMTGGGGSRSQGVSHAPAVPGHRASRFGRSARRIVRAVAAARAAYRRRRAVRELSALSDLTLKDIGVARGEIPAVVAALERMPVAANDNASRKAVRAARQCGLG